MAKLGSNSSFVWSLLAARDVVREGSTWQIGDGSRIRVTRHKWLPNAQVFLHEPNTEMKDTLIRTENKSETFSVRTAYRVPLRLKSTALAEHSSVRVHGVTGGKIWKINVPPKEPETVAHVLWKCPFTRNVWALVRGQVQKCSNDVVDFFLLFKHMQETLEPSELDRWAITAWSI
uniref:Reverse transcriptase zinc-binding domain-containing protein n=1 Tax=Quercus lobata TaxID=97700 RepID=A0A7N2MKP0_QUELO